MWHIQTMEYYSAIKRNEIELFVVRWVGLESVIKREVNQKEKNKYHILTHICGIKKNGTDIQYANIYIWNKKKKRF